jgi:hypothetical protein
MDGWIDMSSNVTIEDGFQREKVRPIAPFNIHHGLLIYLIQCVCVCV